MAPVFAIDLFVPAKMSGAEGVSETTKETGGGGDERRRRQRGTATRPEPNALSSEREHPTEIKR